MDIDDTMQGQAEPLLPLAHFPGQIVQVDTVQALTEALKTISAQTELGLDTESRPSFRRGESHPVALLQLATNTTAWLLRLQHIGLSPELREVLCAPHILKIGASLHDDWQRLQRSYGAFTPHGYLDLQGLMPALGVAGTSLRKMSQALLGLRVSKQQQLSNWDKDDLSPAQQQYAATDAWLCLQLYRLPKVQACLENEGRKAICR